MVVTVNEVYPQGVGARPDLEARMVATPVLMALAKMLSSMPAAKRVVGIDTVPALALTKAEIAKAGNSAALTFETVKAVGSGAPTVNVKTVPPTLVAFSGTKQSETISGSPAISIGTKASDPDIVSDSDVPENSIPDADLFTFTGIRDITPIH
ncbi:hypothetical protein NC653_022502 [Populus alba x Populus x berolinensis]|uniref:Uncharacterized protein n=1 Tax=Populus alba x Populus x berolinensis TaxID=444605 RepID=A0AAD6Q9U6_9ROSI|nr:hypothetical protein NC653_022502 [Populus alba x Populus x berolinensis]